jgi:hypothetical protein
MAGDSIFLYDVQSLDVDCPRCGADDPSVFVGFVDRKTGKRVIESRAAVALISAGVWGLLAAILYWLIPLVSGVSTDSMLKSIPYYWPAVAAAAVYVVLMVRNSLRIAAAARVRFFKCLSCHHKWKAGEGRVIPERQD